MGTCSKNTIYWIEDYNISDKIIFYKDARIAEAAFKEVIEHGVLYTGEINTSLSKADLLTIIFNQKDFKKVLLRWQKLREK